MQTYKTDNETHRFHPADIKHFAEVVTEGNEKAILVQIEGLAMPIILTPKASDYENFRDELLADYKKFTKFNAS